MSKINVSNSVNMVMQSKGGAGKSVVSFLMGNWLKDNVGDVKFIDTDPNNPTFSSYKALEVETINIVKKVGKERMIDQSKFDEFLESFIENYGAGLVDTGSGDFLYINSYMISNDIPAILEEVEKQLILHVPINYGSSQAETMKCLFSLCTNYPNTPIVVWGNEFNEVATSELDIKAVNKKTGGNIIGLVKIEKRNADTHEADFKKLLTKGLTFNEVKPSKEFGIIQSRRLLSIQSDIYNQLDQLFTFDGEESESE